MDILKSSKLLHNSFVHIHTFSKISINNTKKILKSLKYNFNYCTASLRLLTFEKLEKRNKINTSR